MNQNWELEGANEWAIGDWLEQLRRDAVAAMDRLDSDPDPAYDKDFLPAYAELDATVSISNCNISTKSNE
jgi:hypothetical protein